jgi:hypothetical protein
VWPRKRFRSSFVHDEIDGLTPDGVCGGEGNVEDS